MSHFETEFVYINALYQSHCSLWLKYIDDLFCTWEGPPATLEEFFSQINNTTIIKEMGGTLNSDLYTKTTDRNSLLLYQSCHPMATKRSIPISQFHRVRKIVSDENTCKTQLDKMEMKFTQRGYPRKLLQDCRYRPGSTRDRNLTHRIPLVHTFTPLPTNYIGKSVDIGHCCRLVIRTYWNLEHPFYPALESLTGIQTQRKSTFPCLQCAQCADVLKGHKISHPFTGMDIPIQGFFYCDSQYVVYAIKCPCGKIYVGKTTQAVKDCIFHHKSDIRCGRDHLPMPHHFHNAGHTIAQLRFLVLEQVLPNRRGGNRVRRLKLREAFWIRYLQIVLLKWARDGEVDMMLIVHAEDEAMAKLKVGHNKDPYVHAQPSCPSF
ncbi:unnamed protein product, partial [Ranitomeya imitator]